MVRLLLFLVVLALAAYGLTWLAENPGEVTLTWRGIEYDVSLLFALGIVLALARRAWRHLVDSALRFPRPLVDFARLARAPARKRLHGAFARHDRHWLGRRPRRQQARRGGAKVPRRRAADQAACALRLRSSTAIARGAVAAFNEMLEHRETHALGLRGLHVEARRSGDTEAALDYAAARPQTRGAALGGAGGARRSRRSRRLGGRAGDRRIQRGAKLLDKPTANRWRAVLKTAIAQERAERDAKGALALAQEAWRSRPALVPAAALCGKLTAAPPAITAARRRSSRPPIGDAASRSRRRLSARAAWRFGGDRLARARALARVAPFDPESQMTIARAALDAHDLVAARAALAPLLRGDAGAAAPDRAGLPADGRNRGGRRRRGRGARMAEPRRARAARPRLGRRRRDQRSLVAGLAFGRPRRASSGGRRTSALEPPPAAVEPPLRSAPAPRRRPAAAARRSSPPPRLPARRRRRPERPPPARRAPKRRLPRPCPRSAAS